MGTDASEKRTINPKAPKRKPKIEEYITFSCITNDNKIATKSGINTNTTNTTNTTTNNTTTNSTTNDNNTLQLPPPPPNSLIAQSTVKNSVLGKRKHDEDTKGESISEIYKKKKKIDANSRTKKN